jgi:ribose 5-phosphate isomerase
VAEIRNPARLDRDLLAIPGVVGTGLFVGLADLVLVAMRDGTIETLRPPNARQRLIVRRPSSHNHQ